MPVMSFVYQWVLFGCKKTMPLQLFGCQDGDFADPTELQTEEGPEPGQPESPITSVEQTIVLADKHDQSQDEVNCKATID